MPNHVTTVLTITGPDDAIDAFVARHITKITEGRRTGENFDFDTVIPMPQSIKDTMGPDPFASTPSDLPKWPGDTPVAWYAQALVSSSPRFEPAPRGYTWLPVTVRTMADLRAWLDENHPTAAFWGKRALLAAAETGHSGWYDWCVAEWGTKWGAYDYEHRGREPGKLTIKFETAWSVPLPILRKLSEMNPALMFAIESVDEGGPEYAGAFVAGVGSVERCADEEGERYERVMQRKPYSDDEDDEPAAPEVSP